MTYDGVKYKAVIGNIGATITRKCDNASVWMQGDDVLELTNELEALDDYTYPRGPFKSHAEHIDAVLDAYEGVLTKRETTDPVNVKIEDKGFRVRYA
jgi:hypothetical protein